MLTIKNKDLEDYYWQKFAQHLIYSPSIISDLKKYNDLGFLTDEFFEAFEKEVKFQAYNHIIDLESVNNILRIIAFINAKTTDKLKKFILDELAEVTLTQTGKNAVEDYHFELIRRLGKRSYATKATKNDIASIQDEIRKSMANDFVVLNDLLSFKLKITKENAHFVLDSLNVIKLEHPAIIACFKNYITEVLTNYKKIVDNSIKSNPESDFYLPNEDLTDLDYSKTRINELVRKIKR